MNQTLDLRSRLARIGLPIAAVLGIAAFVIAGGRAGLFAGLDLATFDLALGYVIAVERESPVVLVPIREADLNRFGYPIGDAHLAKALERIVAAGARAVAVDLYRPDPIPPGSDALGRIAQESEIIFIRQLPSRDPSAVVAPAYVVPANQGFSELPIDVDGVTRRSLLIAWDEAGSPSLSLALRASLRFLEEEGHSLGPDPDRAEGMRLGETALPALSADFGGYVGEDDRGYQILVDPRPDLAPRASVSFGALLDGDFDPKDLAGRLVLVGTAATSVKDQFDTPLTRSDGRARYGLEVHAGIIDHLLGLARGTESPMRSLDAAAEAALVLFAAGLGILVGVRVRHPLAKAGAFALVLALGIITFVSGLGANWWVPFVPGALAFTLASGIGLILAVAFERADKEALHGLFGRYAPRGIIDLLWDQRADLLENGKPRSVELPATILMGDVGGSTQTIHSLPLATATEWIDEYVELMGASVMEEGGVVVEYGGDGLKADFGVPLPREIDALVAEDACRAVRAALAIGRGTEIVNARMEARGLPATRIRMGICSGIVAARAIGSEDALRYTTIGDAANLAAHLESTAKEEFRDEGLAWRILVSESTRLLLGDAFEIEPFGSYSMKGVETQVHRVWGVSK